MKTNLPFLVVILAFANFCLVSPPAFGADDSITVSLTEALKLLEGLPDLEGKSEDEAKKIFESNPDIVSRANRAEKKVRSVLDKMGLETDNESLADVAKELDSISELRGKSDEEIGQVMSENSDVRNRVSSAGRHLSTGGGMTERDGLSGAERESESVEEPLVPDEIGIDPLESDSAPTFLDDIVFGELQWDFGGFKGEKAEKEEVRIANLKMSKDGLSFEYVEDLSHWGLADKDYSGALACLFVCDRDGRWVGGKFDWISSSRKTRSFKNVYGGYKGWSLSNVPNPCPVAFVIVSKDGKKRSNVIAGIWKR